MTSFVSGKSLLSLYRGKKQFCELNLLLSKCCTVLFCNGKLLTLILVVVTVVVTGGFRRECVIGHGPVSVIIP